MTIALVAFFVGALATVAACVLRVSPDKPRLAEAGLAAKADIAVDDAREIASRPTDVFDLEADQRTLCVGQDTLVSAVLRRDVAVSELTIGEMKSNPVITSFPRVGKHGVAATLTGTDRETGERVHQTRSLTFRVVRCPERPTIWLGKSRGAIPSTLELSVVYQHQLGDSVSYTWDFGDGTRERSDEPRMSHTYDITGSEGRARTYIVSVAAVDEQGREATSRTHYKVDTDPLANRAAMELVAATPVTEYDEPLEPDVLAPPETQMAPGREQ